MSSLQTKEDKEMEKRKKKHEDYLEALNKYFSLKQDYEHAFTQQKNKILKNKALNKREKQGEFKRLKPKCVNCKRPVSTIFSTTYDTKEDGRKLKCQCGDRTNPCNLNIEINLGKAIRLEEFIEEEDKNISKLRLEIVKDKNDLIFGYISAEEALSKFEQSKEELTKATTNYELILEKYLMVTNNTKLKEDLKKMELEIQANISYIREAIKKDKDTKTFQDVIHFQVNEMTPRLEKLRNTKYGYNAVECSTEGCFLIQKKIKIEDLETNLSENDVGVLSFAIGMPSKEKNTKQPDVEAEQLEDIYERRE